MENQAELERVPEASSFSMAAFDHAQRVAKMLASSNLIPKEFQGNVQNTLIALEMANRIGASPLMVMQNLYIVHGRPSWSSSFIIAALNSCRRFSPLRFELSGEGDAMECFAWAYELSTNEKIMGPTVTMKMAKAEGWIDKNGSKWKTMPTLMIRYRSAAFFGRLYAPDIMMGMHTKDELIDAEVVSSNGNGNHTPQQIEESGITIEMLQSLLDQKQSLMNKEQIEHAKRILVNKEVDNYRKLHSLLTSLHNVE